MTKVRVWHSPRGFGPHVFLKPAIWLKQAIEGGKIHCEGQRINSWMQRQSQLVSV